MSGADADEEMHEMADALGALATAAAASHEEFRGGSPSRPTQGPLSTPDAFLAGVSRQRSAPRPEMQKWVQCNRCQKWRKVPFNLKDDELPEDWECKHNVWDPRNASCMTQQALSNEEIDEILATQQQELLLQQHQQQEAHYEEPSFEEAEPDYYDGEGGEDDYMDGDDDMGDGADDDPEASKRLRAKFGNRSKLRRAGSDVLPAGMPSPGRRGGRGGRIGGTRGRGLTPRGGRGGRGGRGASRGGRATRTTAAGLTRRGSGGRAFGRGGLRNVSEAAEALLGMGIAGEGEMYDAELQSMMLLDPAEQLVLQRPDFPYPRDTLRPGRVVWAKVEGHDWWPAKIVRRRAVPREVGPPPGGHSSVLLYIPVVFFTNKGIPGEVEERLDTAQGIVAASMRALGMGEEEEDEEAEYAWLPLDCLKPFKVGDVSGNGEAGPIVDQNLRTSIAHAEAAMRLAEQPSNGTCLLASEGAVGGAVKAESAINADDELFGESARGGTEEDFLSDSDGGWGAPTQFQAAAARGFRGRGRGGRRGRGRGRGGRRGRGRGRGAAARASDEEDDAFDDMTPLEPMMNPADPFNAVGGVPGLVPVQKPQVEAIYGWRFPLSEAEKAQERERQRQLELERHRILDRLRRSSGAGSPNAEAIADAVAAATAVAAAAVSADKAAAATAASGVANACAAVHVADAVMATDEADAAAALLGFGDEAADSGATCAGATAAPAASAGGLAGGLDASGHAGVTCVGALGVGADREPEYLVKWSYRSHLHNEWVKESVLMGIARRKLLNFKKRHGDRPCNSVDEAWTRPERFVSRRPSPSGPGWEVLIKWTGLGYEQATWEAEGNKALLQPEYVALHTAMWTRCKRALYKASRAAAEAAAEAFAAAATAPASIPEWTEQPSFVTGGQLQAHQLQALNWLRRMWACGQHAILADEMGLGKTATVATFLQCLIHEFKVTGPLLIVAPQATLNFWEGDWSFWAGGGVASNTAGSGSTHADSSVSKDPLAFATAALAAASGSPGVSAINMVVYTGTSQARILLHEQELWLAPSSLDRKGSMGRGREDCPSKVPKADVVIAGYEHVLSDLAALKAIPWDTVVVDLRQRSRGVSGRSTGALAELGGRHRLLLANSNPAAAPLDEIIGFAQFVRPDVQAYEPGDYLASEGATEAARSRLAEALEARCCRRLGREVVRHVITRQEVQIPVELSEQQVEAYRTVLARHFEVLADPRPPRHGGHRAALLKHICNELRKVCHHPYLLDEFRSDFDDVSTQPAMATDAAASNAGVATEAPGSLLLRNGTHTGIPAGAAAGQPSSSGAVSSLLAASGKLVVLDKLLREIRRRGHSILVLSQATKTLDLLETYIQQTFGSEAAIRVDSSTPSAVRHARISGFNAAATSAMPAAATSGGGAPPAVAMSDQDSLRKPANASALFIALMSTRALGLGTNLPTIQSVVLFDSDWHPRLDMQALRRAYRIGKTGQLTVYRLYARGTVDERLLMLSERRRGLEHVFQAGPSRGSSLGGRVLEEVLKWGAGQLFRQHFAAGEGAVDVVPSERLVPGSSGSGEANGGDCNAGPGPGSKSGDVRRQERGVYTDEHMREIVELGQVACCSSGSGRSVDAAAIAAGSVDTSPATAAIGTPSADAGGADGDAGCSTAAGSAGATGMPLGPGLELVTVRTWADVDKPVEEDLPAASDEADEDIPEDKNVDEAEGAGADDDLPAGGGAAGPATVEANIYCSEGASAAYANSALLPGSRGGDSVGSVANALFWSSMLRERYEALKREEEHQQLLMMQHEEGLHTSAGGRRGSVMDLDSRDDGDDMGDLLAHDDDEADDETYRPTRGPGSASFGMQDSYDDGTGVSRPGGRGRGRGRGRGGFMSGGRGGRGRGGRRRIDHDVDDGGPYGSGVAYAMDGDRPLKKPRRQGRGIGGIGGGIVEDGVGGAGGGDAPAGRVREVLLREVSRMEAVKKAISDPSTPEHAVAQRSYTRLKEVAAELELPAEAATAISDMACQVADILVMMRQEEEAPSDFQDYTLVAIIAVAAHLVKVALGEDYGLRRLGERYGHDLASLDQVFWHILTRLSYYRELHVRSSQLAADGNLTPAEAATLMAATGGSGAVAIAAAGGDAGDRGLRGGGTGPEAGGGGTAGPSGGRNAADAIAGSSATAVPVVSEVDSFASRLQAILQSDVSTIVYAQVSQENIPLGPLATLMPLLQMAGVLNDPSMKTVLKSTRECQENLVVLDRSHSMKVQQIQKEYQDFMEKVRSKAQSAIDTANRDYQNSKATFTQRMNLYIEYLQSQIPLQRLSEMAHHLQRTAQQAQASQQHQQQAVAAAAVAAAAAAAGAGGTAATGTGGAAEVQVAVDKPPATAAGIAGAGAGGTGIVSLVDPTALAAIAAAMQGAAVGGTTAAAAAAAAGLMGLSPLGALDVSGGSAVGGGMPASATQLASAAQSATVVPATGTSTSTAAGSADVTMAEASAAATGSVSLQPAIAASAQQQQGLIDARASAGVPAAAATTPHLEHILIALAANRISLDQIPEPIRLQLSALSGGKPIHAHIEQPLAASAQGNAAGGGPAAVRSSSVTTSPATNAPHLTGAANKATSPVAVPSSPAVAAATVPPSMAAVAAAAAAMQHQQQLLNAVAGASGLPPGTALVQQQPAARRPHSDSSAGRPPLHSGTVPSQAPAVSPTTSGTSGTAAPSSKGATTASGQPAQPTPLPHTHSHTDANGVLGGAATSTSTRTPTVAAASAPYGAQAIAAASLSAAASSYQQLVAQQHHVMQRALGPPPPGMPNVSRAHIPAAPATTPGASAGGHTMDDAALQAGSPGVAPGMATVGGSTVPQLASALPCKPTSGRPGQAGGLSIAGDVLRGPAGVPTAGLEADSNGNVPSAAPPSMPSGRSSEGGGASRGAEGQQGYAPQGHILSQVQQDHDSEKQLAKASTAATSPSAANFEAAPSVSEASLPQHSAWQAVPAGSLAAFSTTPPSATMQPDALPVGLEPAPPQSAFGGGPTKAVDHVSVDAAAVTGGSEGAQEVGIMLGLEHPQSAPSAPVPAAEGGPTVVVSAKPRPPQLDPPSTQPDGSVRRQSPPSVPGLPEQPFAQSGERDSSRDAGLNEPGIGAQTDAVGGSVLDPATAHGVLTHTARSQGMPTVPLPQQETSGMLGLATGAVTQSEVSVSVQQLLQPGMQATAVGTDGAAVAKAVTSPEEFHVSCDSKPASAEIAGSSATGSQAAKLQDGLSTTADARLPEAAKSQLTAVQQPQQYHHQPYGQQIDAQYIQPAAEVQSPATIASAPTNLPVTAADGGNSQQQQLQYQQQYAVQLAAMAALPYAAAANMQAAAAAGVAAQNMAQPRAGFAFDPSAYAAATGQGAFGASGSYGGQAATAAHMAAAAAAAAAHMAAFGNQTTAAAFTPAAGYGTSSDPAMIAAYHWQQQAQAQAQQAVASATAQGQAQSGMEALYAQHAAALYQQQLQQQGLGLGLGAQASALDTQQQGHGATQGAGGTQPAAS